MRLKSRRMCMCMVFFFGQLLSRMEDYVELESFESF